MLMLAGVALTALTLVVGFVPKWAPATEFVSESERKRVSCGSVLVRTSWSSDEGCVEPRERQVMWMFAFGCVSLGAGLLGGGLWLANNAGRILDMSRATGDPWSDG